MMKSIGYEKTESEIKAALNKFDLKMATMIQDDVEDSSWKENISSSLKIEEESSKVKLIDVILLNLQRKKIKFKRKRRFLEKKEKIGINDNLNEVTEQLNFMKGTRKLKKLINVRNMLEIQKKCRTASKPLSIDII